MACLHHLTELTFKKIYLRSNLYQLLSYSSFNINEIESKSITRLVHFYALFLPHNLSIFQPTYVQLWTASMVLFPSLSYVLFRTSHQSYFVSTLVISFRYTIHYGVLAFKDLHSKLRKRCFSCHVSHIKIIHPDDIILNLQSSRTKLFLI